MIRIKPANFCVGGMPRRTNNHLEAANKKIGVALGTRKSCLKTLGTFKKIISPLLVQVIIRFMFIFSADNLLDYEYGNARNYLLSKYPGLLVPKRSREVIRKDALIEQALAGRRPLDLPIARPRLHQLAAVRNNLPLAQRTAAAAAALVAAAAQLDAALPRLQQHEAVRPILQVAQQTVAAAAFIPPTVEPTAPPHQPEGQLTAAVLARAPVAARLPLAQRAAAFERRAALQLFDPDAQERTHAAGRAAEKATARMAAAEAPLNNDGVVDPLQPIGNGLLDPAGAVALDHDAFNQLDQLHPIGNGLLDAAAAAPLNNIAIVGVDQVNQLQPNGGGLNLAIPARRGPGRPPLQATLDRRARDAAAAALLGGVIAPRLRGRPRLVRLVLNGPERAQANHAGVQARRAIVRRAAAQARNAAAEVRRAAAQARNARHPRAVNLRATTVSEEEAEENEMAEIDGMFQAVVNQPIDGLPPPPPPPPLAVAVPAVLAIAPLLQVQQLPQPAPVAVLVVDPATCKICQMELVNRIMTCGHALCHECEERLYEPARERFFLMWQTSEYLSGPNYMFCARPVVRHVAGGHCASSIFNLPIHYRHLNLVTTPPPFLS